MVDKQERFKWGAFCWYKTFRVAFAFFCVHIRWGYKMDDKIFLKLRIAETMHNANAALDAPAEVILSEDVAATVKLCMELRKYCDSYTADPEKGRRHYLRKWVQGTEKDPKEKYCKLPEWADKVTYSGKYPRKSNKKAESRETENQWEPGQYVDKSDFSRFLADVTGISFSSIENRLYDGSKRLNAGTTSQLSEKLADHVEGLGNKKEDFYQQFGRFPIGNENLKKKRRELLDEVKRIWKGKTDTECMFVLGLSAETLQNLMNRFDMDVSTAYRFLITLCRRNEETKVKRIYHTFYYHPLPDNAADEIAGICTEYYEPVARGLSKRLGCALEEAAANFWGILKGQLRDLDKRKKPDSKLPDMYGFFFPGRGDSFEEILLEDQIKEGY